MSKVNVSPTKAKRLARSLLRANRHGKSWRVIAKEVFNDKINYATLNRFAINKGEWTPKDEKILAALGLIQPPKLIERIFEMSPKELLWRLENRK